MAKSRGRWIVVRRGALLMAAWVAAMGVLLVLFPRLGFAPAPAAGRAPLRGAVIVVDPGHGGIDSGAVSGRVKEKDVNLAVSRALAAELRGLGAQVALTRTSDRHLATGAQRYLRDRRARAELAARLHANLFVSVHANYVAQRGARGPLVIWNPSANPQGRPLAQAIKAALQRELNFPTGVRTLPIKVLAWSGVPSALVEAGFISNVRDRTALADPAYQVRVGVAIADGVRAYWSARRFGRLLERGYLWAAVGP